jgi:hypothetical protein
MVCLQSFPRKTSSQIQRNLIPFLDANEIFQFMPRDRYVRVANICYSLHNVIILPGIVCTDAKFTPVTITYLLESGWNLMAHGDARERKWRGNWRMKRVATTLHTTSEHGVSSITTADAHTSAASSQLNWRPCRFKWTRPFRRKTKSGFCACAITFQTQSTSTKIKTE